MIDHHHDNEAAHDQHERANDQHEGANDHAHAEAPDELAPDEPKTPLWLTALGGGLLLVLGIGWLATRPAEPTLSELSPPPSAAPSASAAASPPPVPAPPPEPAPAAALAPSASAKGTVPAIAKPAKQKPRAPKH